MALALTIQNHQKVRAVNTRLLRQMVRLLVEDLLSLPEADLGVFIVAAPEMTHLNETFLRHAGSTDVITFDYAEEGGGHAPRSLHGELFVCVDEALIQARRFRTTWQMELVRYIVHGVLHLHGFDDQAIRDRRRMKREENRLLHLLAYRFPLSRVAHTPRFKP